MNMVKRIFINKNCKILFIFFISLVFLLIIGKSFAVFSSNNSKLIANINVNDLLFNLTTNDGESDDRILHLKPGMTEEFDIVLTNLNDISTKYNLVYNVCKDIKCTNFYDNIPDDIEIYKSSETPDDLNGIIKNGFDFKKNINLVTVNNSDLDYYLKIDLNAGYEWNDLEITNLDINDFSSNSTDMEIIAFVDGIQVEKFPATCGYSANVELYSNNVKLSDTNSRVKCDGVRWLIDYADLSLNPDKIIIKFQRAIEPVDFATDSWDTIANAVKIGNTSSYQVGDTKCVHIDGYSTTTNNGCNGDFLVRIVNMSTSTKCDNSLFSETACGFVLEFVDIILKSKMSNTETNIGGWPNTYLRTFLNGVQNDDGSYNRDSSLFSKLPVDLQGIIIDTRVVSGHGYKDSNPERVDGNWESIDKLYFFSLKELTGKPEYDTLKAKYTNYLDYYDGIRLVPKYYNNTYNVGYWLRSPDSSETGGRYFYYISSSSSQITSPTSLSVGVAPAFRIG